MAVDKKKQLPIFTAENRVIEGTTCFAVQSQANIDCQRQKCPSWINHPEGHNCVHIATSQQGQHTLQCIGKIFELTRMRVCQIEKDIRAKIREISQ